MIETLKSWDTALFLFLNSKHNAFFDVVMSWTSYRFTWIPLYIFFFYLVIKHFRSKTWLVVVATVLVILLADQISVHAFKFVFLRYRPCHNLILQSQVHLNDGCGGTYGFISSHAANTFALAMFLFLLFKEKIRYFGWFMFGWACFVSYSRIYNGVHYPADVACGAIVGMGIGATVYQLFQYSHRKIYRLS